MPSRFSIPGSIVAAAILVGGCGGDAEQTQSECMSTRTTVPADEVTRFGFSGAQLLAHAEGSHMATLGWLSGPEAYVATNAIAGETIALSVRIARAGTVRVLEQEPRLPDAQCPDGVEADVDVEVVSPDGAFAETGRGQLFSTSSILGADLSFALPRPPMGTLRIDAIPSSGLIVWHLGFGVNFREGSLQNGFLILVLDDDDGSIDPEEWTVLVVAQLAPVSATQQ